VAAFRACRAHLLYCWWLVSRQTPRTLLTTGHTAVVPSQPRLLASAYAFSVRRTGWADACWRCAGVFVLRGTNCRGGISLLPWSVPACFFYTQETQEGSLTSSAMRLLFCRRCVYFLPLQERRLYQRLPALYCVRRCLCL